MRRTSSALATMNLMFAANVWHWWIGLVLLFAGIGAIVSVAVGYVAKVSASRYPGRRQRQQ
jgi:formate-dependent nitrite reductase membrane component NrfD